MRNKQWQHFTIAIVVSFVVHFAVLTILFKLPDVDEQDGYKKVRVKIGIQNKRSVDSIAGEKQDAAYNIVGTMDQSLKHSKNKKSVAGYDAGSKLPDALQDKDADVSKDKEAKTAPKVNKVVGRLQTDVVIPKTLATSSALGTSFIPGGANDEEGTIIGNSLDRNANKLDSYEAMLPLWLEKFKQSPSDSKGRYILGSGEIFIKIDRKGRVLLAKVLKSTGSPVLDRVLMEMIADADPVLPVPLDYYAQRKTFSYKIPVKFEEPRSDE